MTYVQKIFIVCMIAKTDWTRKGRVLSKFLDGLQGTHVIGWSLQSEDVWRQLQRQGVHYTHPQYLQGSDFNTTFLNAYEWMRRQMHKRGFNPENHYPVWFYTRVDRKKLQEHATQSEQSVLLVCRFVAPRVLLSDYYAWHHVLNDWYLDHTAVNVEAWFTEMEQRLGMPLGNHENSLSWPTEIRLEIERSWERIFNIQHWLRVYPDSVIQGTVAQLKLSDVVQAIPLDFPDKKRTTRIAQLIQRLTDKL